MLLLMTSLSSCSAFSEWERKQQQYCNNNTWETGRDITNRQLCITSFARPVGTYCYDYTRAEKISLLTTTMVTGDMLQLSFVEAEVSGS